MKSVRGMIGKLQRRATGGESHSIWTKLCQRIKDSGLANAKPSLVLLVDATASSGQPASVPQVGLDGPPEEVVARAVVCCLAIASAPKPHEAEHAILTMSPLTSGNSASPEALPTLLYAVLPPFPPHPEFPVLTLVCSQGDEVILLPTIVESAECSPSAAAEAAHTLRKFLSKDYYSKPTHQYNAIMIIRILADNPGPRFTRHIDKKFVDTTKDLLQRSKDPSVLSLMWETLDTFENEKAQDEGLAPLIEMWKAEKVRGASLGTTVRPSARPSGSCCFTLLIKTSKI